MKASWSFVSILCLTFLAPAYARGRAPLQFTPPPSTSSKSCQHDDHTFRCVRFIKNYDGDTLTVEIPQVHPLLGKNISVRILGIDTPEIKTSDECEKAAGRTAQRLVENLLEHAQEIELRNIQRDKYFRVLADVYVDGKSVKELLLKNGLAYLYDGGTKEHLNWCERAPASQTLHPRKGPKR